MKRGNSLTVVRPPKSADAIKELVRTKDMADAVKLTSRAIQQVVTTLGLAPSQVGVVMDIDDTVLFEKGRGSTAHPLGEDVIHLKNGMKKMYDACGALGYKRFFVTARPALTDNMEWTRRCLHRAGISKWDACYHCPVEMRSSYKSISKFKRMARRQIEKEFGVKVVLSVGDRFADLVDHSHLDHASHSLGGRSDDLFVMTISDKSHGGMVGLKLPQRGL